MTWIKNLLAKIIGKQIDTDKWGISKTKLIAIVYVIVIGVQEISKAWGHPITIPSEVFRFLEGCGLWTVRDAIKS